MVQPQYSPQEVLERVKLMMKYDTSKTLNENLETTKEPINETPLIFNPVSVAAIAAWIYNTQGGGDSFSKTKNFFEGCSKNIKTLKPTVDKSEYRAAADAIYNAIEGIGTDKNAIKSALNSMPTVADLCALNSWYSTQYGDLYDDLDSDIDGTDFTKYVWSAIAPQVADAELDIKTSGGTDNTSGGTDNSGGSKYTSCPDTLPIKQFCKNETIKKVQACLRMPTKYQTGNFGPITQKALEGKGQDGTTITTETIVAVCGNSAAGTPAAGTPAAGTPATKPDEIEQVDAEDSTDLLNN
jgi:hypothetical protein